jgi:hypothetical protein
MLGQHPQIDAHISNYWKTGFRELTMTKGTEHPAVMQQRLLEEKHNLILENEKLRAALEKYGMHLADCPANGGTDGDPCECGLDQLLGEQ